MAYDKLKFISSFFAFFCFFRFDCGFFMLKFLELWDGRVSPAITSDQIPALRKVLTARWLEHAENKLKR